VDRFIDRTFTDPATAAAHLETCGDDPDAYLRMVRAATLADFRTPALEIATHAPVPAQVVRLDHRSKLEAAYAPHCFVLPFIFGDATQWRFPDAGRRLEVRIRTGNHGHAKADH
jgi:para-nitrobenzyl esterase